MEKLQRMLAVFLILASLLCAGAVSTCKPAEQGQTYSLQCSVPLNKMPLTWETGSTLDDIYCQCRYDDIVKRCVCYKAGVSATQSVSGNTVTSIFTVNSPQRGQTGTTWSCTAESISYLTCDFNVYARARNVTCQIQEPEPISNTSITVRCQTEDIYPSTGCLFYKKTNNSIRANLTAGANGVTVETGSEQCTLRVAGTYLGRGDHQFGVVMYPNVTGSEADIDYGVTSPDTTSIKIGDPSAELSKCPTASSDGSVLSDYIKDRTNHTCTCTRTDHAYFPVDISWEGYTAPSQDRSGTLTFTAARNQAFTCTVTNSLQWTKKVAYRPQVAYGPIRVDVTLLPANQGPVDLCQGNDDVSFPVQCQVSSPGVVPSATFSYSVNTTTSSVVAQTPTVGSTNTATVTVTQAGTCGITCLAKNSRFEEIQAQNTVSVVVREPPSAPTIMISQSSSVSFTSGDILTVEEGGASVTCHVTGGYPPQVKELRLSCGKDETFPNPDNQAQMSVNFTRNMHGQSCSCMATHDSTCYSRNTVSYMLDVQYPPAVLTFNANGNSSHLTVEKDSTLTFVCEAEGNPRPVLSLQHDGSGDVTSVANSYTTVTRLAYNLTMDCLDTGVFTCTAQAPAREDKSTVEVNVLCPQQLESSQSQNTVYGVEINSTFDIIITVYGYPKPTSLQLHGDKKELQQDDYAVTYTETRPPHGIVTLTFYSLTEKYFQNYTLTVTNTEGSLVYYFSISGDVGLLSDSEDVAVGAIVGGVIAGIVVILAVAVAVYFIRRRGMLKTLENKSKRNDDAMNSADLQNGASVYYNQPASYYGQGDGTVNSHRADRYMYENTAEMGSAVSQNTSFSGTDYENVVPPLEPASADSHSPYEN